jgi:hypothetical protein
MFKNRTTALVSSMMKRQELCVLTDDDVGEASRVGAFAVNLVVEDFSEVEKMIVICVE